MGKKQNKGKKAAKNGAATGGSNNVFNHSDGMMVDPARVRFQHSRIRPVFSGCGRSVEQTLDEIRKGNLKPSDLPPIQVLVGPLDKDDGEPWYFSLNNRRLWVLKRCREEGLLEDTNQQIYVRVRKPKSDQESARYTLKNCALDARIMSEKPKPATTENKTIIAELVGKDEPVDEGHPNEKRETSENVLDDQREKSEDVETPSGTTLNRFQLIQDDSSDDDESSDEGGGPSNRFSALM